MSFMFEVGKTYNTQEGKTVTVLGRTTDKGYECLECSDKVYRYDRSTSNEDAGRCTGSSFEYTNPRNFVRSDKGIQFKTITLLWTHVRIATTYAGITWFNARDIALALEYASPKDAARKMKSDVYLEMSSVTKGIKVYKVLTVQHVIDFAYKRNKNLAEQIKKIFNTYGILYSTSTNTRCIDDSSATGQLSY